MDQRYIGLMSGTSLDGVDAVLVTLGGPRHPVLVHGHVHLPFSSSLRLDLMQLNQASDNELHRAALAANALSLLYAQAVSALLEQCSTLATSVRAIGAHGQTVRHRPGDFDGIGYTVQLLNGALLAERCGIDVVCDFRSRDVAAGGQGAPLVPGFHAASFGQPGLAQAVLNLGGMANITLLHADGSVGGFDCGPGNVLLDLWCERNLGHPYDQNGQWAQRGVVDQALLNHFLAEPFLQLPPPKSTGRDLFNGQWLDRKLRDLPVTRERTSADIQCTLAELTASAASTACRQYLPEATRLLVCGGGVMNLHLMQRLAVHLPNVDVQPTDLSGLPAMQVEAAAFAWLAQAFVIRQASNCPEVTGARGQRILGALHLTG